MSEGGESSLESIGPDTRRHRWDVGFGANPGRDRRGGRRTPNGVISFDSSSLNSSTISVGLEMSFGYAASYLSSIASSYLGRCFKCGVNGEEGGVATASVEELACNDMAFDKS